MDENVSSVYYDPKRPGGFGGADRLYEDVKKEGKFAISHKEIKEWLMKQDAYTLHKPMRRHTTSFPGLFPFCHWEVGKRPWHRAVFYVF
jgi:hypothetical protein